MAGSEIDIENLVERLQPEVVTDLDVGTGSVVVLEKLDIDDLADVVCSSAFGKSCKKWAGLLHTKRVAFRKLPSGGGGGGAFSENGKWWEGRAKVESCAL